MSIFIDFAGKTYWLIYPSTPISKVKYVINRIDVLPSANYYSTYGRTVAVNWYKLQI